jgi:hypothetical protein
MEDYTVLAKPGMAAVLVMSVKEGFVRRSNGAGDGSENGIGQALASMLMNEGSSAPVASAGVNKPHFARCGEPLPQNTDNVDPPPKSPTFCANS